MEFDEIMVDDTRERAKKRVEELKGFYSHLAVFIIINGILILINLVTSPNSWWFYWVTIFWGIGLVFHAFSVFGSRRMFSKDWEEKKIQQYIDDEKNGK